MNYIYIHTHTIWKLGQPHLFVKTLITEICYKMTRQPKLINFELDHDFKFKGDLMQCKWDWFSKKIHFIPWLLRSYESFFLCLQFFFLFYLFIFKLYNIVLVLPNIEMNRPQVYMCSPSWTLLPPPSPYHPSGSSQCTSPQHPVSCIEPGVATRFIHDIIHVSIIQF